MRALSMFAALALFACGPAVSTPSDAGDDADAGTDAGVDAGVDAGSLPEPVVTQISPEFLTISGGVIELTGIQLGGTPRVVVDGIDATVTSAEAGKIIATVGPTQAGRHVVEVVQPSGTTQGPVPLVVVPRLTIVADGDLSDWPVTARISSDTTISEWGADNELRALYAGFDDDALYLGIEGKAGVDNAIIGYLSVSTLTFGSPDVTSLTDGAGALDNMLSAALGVAAPGFRSQYGFGLFGGAPALENDVAEGMGVRGFATPEDFAWVKSTVKRCNVGHLATCPNATTAVELRLPWRVVADGDSSSAFIPFPAGAHVELFARLVGAGGQSISNQALPTDPNQSTDSRGTVTKVSGFDVR